MPKQKVVKLDIETVIMQKVKGGQIAMKPRWYFALGSILMVLGLAGLTIVSVFLLNLTIFLLKPHGPMGSWRLQVMLSSFPWWVPVIAIVGISLGIWLLKKYDFAYKKNFWLIAAGFIASVFIGAYLMDYLGLNDLWSRQRPMRRFYQQLENPDTFFPRGQGQRRSPGGRQNSPGNKLSR